MASTVRKESGPAQTGGRFFLETLTEGRNLAGRLQGSDVFRHYVTRRMQLVAPAVLLFLATSVACTAASIVFVAGARSSFLVLLALLCAPVVLVGSLFVELYVFFSWLEGRALALAYHRHEVAPRISFGRGGSRARLMTVGLVAALVIGALVAVALLAVAFFRSEGASPANLLARMADIIDASRASLPEWIRMQLPEDTEDLREMLVDWMRTHAKDMQVLGRSVGVTLVHVLL